MIGLKRIEDDEKKNKIEMFYSSIFQNYLDPIKLKKFYGGQPVSMMPESLIHISQKRIEDGEFNYNISAKLDGMRMLLFLHPSMDGFVIFIDRSMNFFEPVVPFVNSCNFICLFDGEMYENVFLCLI